MKRRIIEIDRDKCNGCSACAEACHEGAIAMVDGKAKLMRDDYCDGLGDYLPACPTGAITFVEREAAAYDEQAVLANKQQRMQKQGMKLPCGCPGSHSRKIEHTDCACEEVPHTEPVSRLSQWPVQIKLVPVNAPYFADAKLLIAADCTAYAYAAFHERFIKGHSLTSKPDNSVFDGSRSTPSLWDKIPCETSKDLSSMMFCIIVESVMGKSSGRL